MADFHSSNANRYKGNDIDPEGDGAVTDADSATVADALGSNYPDIADTLGFTSEASTSQPTGSKSGEAWRVAGSKSDLLMTVQAGNGRVAITWNAYYDGSDWRYIVDNEGATLLGIGNMDPGGTNASNVSFANAPVGTADSIISWNSTHIEDGVFTGDADTVDGKHASDLGSSYYFHEYHSRSKRGTNNTTNGNRTWLSWDIPIQYTDRYEAEFTQEWHTHTAYEVQVYDDIAGSWVSLDTTTKSWGTTAEDGNRDDWKMWSGTFSPTYITQVRIDIENTSDNNDIITLRSPEVRGRGKG